MLKGSVATPFILNLNYNRRYYNMFLKTNKYKNINIHLYCYLKNQGLFLE